MARFYRTEPDKHGDPIVARCLNCMRPLDEDNNYLGFFCHHLCNYRWSVAVGQMPFSRWLPRLGAHTW